MGPRLYETQKAVHRVYHKLLCDRQAIHRLDSQVQQLEAWRQSQQIQMQQEPDPEIAGASATTRRCSRCCAIL